MWEEIRWKVLCMYKWGVCIAKGEIDPCDCLTSLNCLTYMTLQLYMWVSWTSMLHYIDYNSVAHSNDVAEMTHDMTRHDNASMFMLKVASMSSYNVAKWWVCSFCSITSPLHGKVYEVFDGLGVRLMLHVHVSTSMVLGMLHVFIRSRKSLLACAPFSSHSLLHHVSSMYLYLQ